MLRSPFLATHASSPTWRGGLERCLDALRRDRQAAARAAGQAVEYPLGWCYFTDHYADGAEALLATLQHRLPGTSWVGAAAMGVAASGVELFDEPALVLMLAPLPRASFRLFSGRQPLHPGEGGFVPHAALVHADGHTPDLQELLPELAARTTTGYLFGGLPSSRTRALQIADAVLEGGLSGVAFAEDVGIVSRVTQGCRPIGPQRRVSRADSNLVITSTASRRSPARCRTSASPTTGRWRRWRRRWARPWSG
jgi:small ligand-binding sensory domain FIST